MEPWIVLLPWGARDLLGAVVLVGLTGLATLAVAWSTWVYEGGVPEIPDDVRVKIAEGADVGGWETLLLTMSDAFVWSVGATGTAGLFLVLGWVRVFQVAKEARQRRDMTEQSGCQSGK